jgi:hypothetical protein
MHGTGRLTTFLHHQAAPIVAAVQAELSDFAPCVTQLDWMFGCFEVQPRDRERAR